MSEEFKDLIMKYPVVIDCPKHMKDPNSIISIYRGSFSLKKDAEVLNATGSIYFKWLPSMITGFSATIEISGSLHHEIFDKYRDSKLFLESDEAGEVHLTSYIYPLANTHFEIAGIFTKGIVIGDSTVPMSSARFALPNLRELIGNINTRNDEGTMAKFNSRLILENGHRTIVLDNCGSYNETHQALKEQGGYAITYSGELTISNKSLTLQETIITMEELGLFLSFLNGRRTAPIYFIGMFNDSTVWEHYDICAVDTYSMVESWPPKYEYWEFNDLWKSFHRIYKEKEGKEFLKSVIHWYISANIGAGAVEGSIVLAQTALELIFNRWIVEEKKMILGDDSRELSASNKIRLILSQLNQDSCIPDCYTDLKEVVKDKAETQDAPESITQIRNAIVHSHKEKRKKLGKISDLTKYYALQMSIWYIELSLLKILDYNGKYHNRCSEALTDQFVPWIKK